MSLKIFAKVAMKKKRKLFAIRGFAIIIRSTVKSMVFVRERKIEGERREKQRSDNYHTITTQLIIT